MALVAIVVAVDATGIVVAGAGAAGAFVVALRETAVDVHAVVVVVGVEEAARRAERGQEQEQNAKLASDHDHTSERVFEERSLVHDRMDQLGTSGTMTNVRVNSPHGSIGPHRVAER
jgi:predicted nucleotidyltransferase